MQGQFHWVCNLCCHTGAHAQEGPVVGFDALLLTFLMIFPQEVSRFHFALDPAI